MVDHVLELHKMIKADKQSTRLRILRIVYAIAGGGSFYPAEAELASEIEFDIAAICIRRPDLITVCGSPLSLTDQIRRRGLHKYLDDFLKDLDAHPNHMVLGLMSHIDDLRHEYLYCEHDKALREKHRYCSELQRGRVLFESILRLLKKDGMPPEFTQYIYDGFNAAIPQYSATKGAEKLDNLLPRLWQLYYFVSDWQAREEIITEYTSGTAS